MRIKTAVILAAGLGSRLGERTKEQPKAFLTIGNQSLIERSIEKLIAAGIEKIVIGTGYLNEHFDQLRSKYPMISTVRNAEYANTGSMYTLFNLRDHINEDFLLLEADLLYEKQALSVIINDSHQDTILASGKTNSNDEVYIEADADQNLNNMSKATEDINHISGELVGINKISRDTFHIMCEYASSVYNQGDFSIHYEDTFVGISIKKPIFILKVDDLAWCEIDDENHLNRALNIVYPKIVKREAIDESH